MSERSYFLTEGLIHEAVELISPAIVALIGGFGGSQGFVRIYVATEKLGLLDAGTVGAGVTADEWKYPYSKLALVKTIMALREKMGTGDILGQPWRLEKADTIYRGGIYKEGIAVGVSGLEEDEDVLVARLIIETLIMLVKRKSKKMSQNLSGTNIHFLT